MKKLLLTSFILTLLATSAQAATISVGNITGINVANMLLGSSSSAGCTTDASLANNCDFKNASGALLNDINLAATVTSNPANYVYSSAAGNNAYIDLGFNGFNIYNGAGNDLVIFIVGNSFPFGLDVFDTNGALMNSGIFSVGIANTVYDNTNPANWLCVGGSNGVCSGGFPLSAIFVDFGDAIAGDIAIGKIHLTLGDAAFSLAGGFHTEPTVVPLPLPALLFSSGLALLGWTGRRKNA
jgi:hypothetical protein